MPLPEIPLMTNDLAVNQRLIVEYLYDLTRYLREGESDAAWLVSGTVTDTTLVAGDTLATTQNVLGTLIQTLQRKGLL